MLHFRLIILLIAFLGSITLGLAEKNLVAVRQEIPILSNEICTKKPHVDSLNLIDSGIMSIQEGALHSCTQVTKIWLEMNKLRILESGVFLSKPNLEEINLYKNELEWIDEDVFDGLTKLEALNLKCNKLLYFPPRFVRDLIVLKNLNLASNKLFDLEINGLMDKLPLLGFINFNGNDISCNRANIIISTTNSSKIILGGAHCEDVISPELTIVSTAFEQPLYCLPDNKWEMHSAERQRKLNELKASHSKKKLL